MQNLPFGFQHLELYTTGKPFFQRGRWHFEKTLCQSRGPVVSKQQSQIRRLLPRNWWIALKICGKRQRKWLNLCWSFIFFPYRSLYSQEKNPITFRTFFHPSGYFMTPYNHHSLYHLFYHHCFIMLWYWQQILLRFLREIISSWLLPI